jgi:acetyltransferase EpsM
VISKDFVTVSPGCHISGNVNIGEGAFLGTGANILEKLNIGEWSRIGAGSTIIKHVEPNTTIVGCPGKAIKTMPDNWHLSE